MGVSFAGNILVQSNGGPLPISSGGTGQTTAPTAINALLPSQTGNNNKILVTDGVNVSWSGVTVTPGGSDTMIQYNDAGTFGGSANFVINKSTGALTSLSTFSGTGLQVSGAAATTRALKFQTAGSDRWLLQANNVNETGSNVGSNFEFVRVADNGATSNQVFTVARLSGIVDFKTTPTINGVAIGTGAGTVTSVDASGSQGVTISGNPVTSTGTIAIGLGNITPTSVAAVGTITGSNLSGTNTGDQTLNSLLPPQSGNAGQYLTTDGTNSSWGTVVGGVSSFNTRTGAVTLTSGDVTTALTFTPYNATNPNGYTTNTGTVTSVAGTGTVSGLTLTGTVTTTGSLTLGGTLSLTSGNVTTALGFTPYNATNPSGYISSITSSNVTTALGYTPVNKAGDTMTGALTATGFTGPLTGNSSTATKLATARSITASGDAAWTVSFDGSADATAALTFATVNASPQTDTFRKVTVNSKGLVTATSAVTASDITTALTFTPYNATNPAGYISGITNGNVTTALGYTPVNKAGDTVSGSLTFTAGTVTGLATPSAGTDATTKNYVDAAIAGLSWKVSVLVATTTNITLSSLQTIDGVTVAVGNRVLVKNQTTTSQNGIYVVAAGAWTRATDSSTAAQLDGEAVYVQQGTVNADTGWTETATITTVGTDPILYAQFSGSGSYTAGTGLSLSGNTFTNTGVLAITTSSGLSTNTNATGAVSITNTGVTSNVAGTNITVSGATGAVTIGLVAAPTIAGTNFTSIPNAALTNSSLTLGSTSMALGSTTTTVAGLSSVTSTTFVGALTGNATTATTATNIAGGAATQVPFQSGASATTFSSDFTYDNTAKQLQIASSAASYPVIIGGNNSISQPAGASSSLLLRAATGNHMRFYTDPGTSGVRGGDFRFQAGGSDTGTGGNIQFSPGLSTSGVSGAIRMVGSVEYLMNGPSGFSGANTVDFAATGMYNDMTLAGNLTLTFANPVGGWGEYTFRFGANPSAYTITWPAAVSWATGSAPIIPTTGITTIKLISIDGGITYLGSVAGNVTAVNDTATNATYYPTLATVTAGPSIVKVSSTKLSFNPSTGVLASTSFSGAGTGLTGTAASLTAGAVSSITSGQVTTALGFTPGSGTVTSVAGTGTVSGLTLTGTVTSSGSLTLGGTLTLTSGQVTTALGFTPYNATNPNSYISAIGINSSSSGAVSNVLFSNVTLGTSTANVSGNAAFTYNQNTGLLTATTFSGAGTSLTGTAASLSIGGTAATATNIANGTANQIPYQTGASTSAFITAPTISSTFLQWTGSAFAWAAAGGGFSSTDDTTTNATYYPAIITSAGGSTAKTSSTKLTFNPSTGTLSATAFNSLSDARAKTNIRALGYGLDDVLKMVGHKYEMIDGGQTSIGLIAQEVQDIVPEVVSANANGMLGINYPILTAVLIEAIKDLTARLAVLEAKV